MPTYPVTLTTRLDAGLCAIRGHYETRENDSGVVWVQAEYETPRELELCVAMSDVWRGDSAAVDRVLGMLDEGTDQGVIWDEHRQGFADQARSN